MLFFQVRLSCCLKILKKRPHFVAYVLQNSHVWTIFSFLSVGMLLSICLIFNQFQPSVAYKRVAYKKKRVTARLDNFLVSQPGNVA